MTTPNNLGESFRNLIPAAWVKECNKVLIHYYSCGIQIETLLSKGYFDNPNEDISENDIDKSALLLLAGIEDQETIYSIAFNVADNNSVTHFSRTFCDKLPDSNYILAVSRIEGETDGELIAESNIEKAIGLLGVSTGRGVVLDFVTKIIVDLKTANVSFPSRIMHIPQKFDFAVLDAAKSTDELRKRCKHLTRSEADRMDLSFVYVCRALAEENLSLRFLLYWTAVEIITGGKPEGFVDRLSKHYGIESTHLADLKKKLHSSEFVDARVALVHRGKSIKLSSFGERLLQIIVADLAFANCNIKSRHALEFSSQNPVEPVFDNLQVGEIIMNLDSVLANRKPGE